MVFVLLLIGFAFPAKAQGNMAVTGSVKDAFGSPIQGVTISTDTKVVYVTDSKGEFTALVDPSKDLTFALLGYSIVVAKPAPTLDIVLEEDAHSLAEGVNLGFTRQYREVLSDAVASRAGIELEKSLMSRLQGTFSGKFSGLTTVEESFEPAYEQVSMYVRGLSTIHGGAAGIVIDGILYDSYSHDILYNISPEEIESVSVLKDGASQAIYGVKGANGVIVINTKRGTPGKLNLRVNLSETVEQPTQRAHCFDSYTYATLRNQAAVNDGRGEFLFYPQAAIDGFKDGTNPLFPNTNWSDMLFRKLSNMQRATIDAVGGNEVVRYSANMNILRQGSFWNTDQKDYKADNEKFKINFRSNIDVNVTKWLVVYMNLAGSVVKAHSPGPNTASNSSIYNLMTYMPSTVYDAVTPEVVGEDGTVLDKGGAVISTINMVDSPYGALNRSGYSRQTNTNIYGQAGLKFDLSFLTPGLWAGAGAGYLSYITSTTANTQKYARFYRDDDWNGLNFLNVNDQITNTELAYSKGEALYGYLSYKAEAGWARDFGKHHIKAYAYGTYQEFDDITGNIAATYDFRRAYSGAELLYDFDRRYALKVATGYSGSDYFPRKTRFIWTPGVSAAWIVSNEHFIKENLPWISLLKFRGSYAITGNDATGYNRYDYMDQVESLRGGFVPFLNYSTTEKSYGNFELEPEKIYKWNFGADLGLGNAFSASFDIFREYMTNGVALSTVNVPAYQGIALGMYPLTNLAQYENKGWEVSLGYRKRLNADFALNVSGHLDYNVNKVIDKGEIELDETYAYRFREQGYPFGQAWGYLTDYSNGNGLFNFQDEIDGTAKYSFGSPRLGDIKYKDLNEDGIIDEKDKAPVGNGSLPRYSFGLDFGFAYRNLEFSMLFQGVADYKRNFAGLSSSESLKDGVYTESHLGAWTAEKWLNDEKITYPALSTTRSTSSSQASDFFFKDASFVRLKNAMISYKLPSKVCDFLGASSFKVYLSGQNLLTVDGMKTNDMPVEGDYFAFPVFRMYRVGVNLTF